MAALPPITQLAGNHWTLFEGYWSQLDAQKTGKIDASTAATFLKKSQLKEPVLHKIWNASDPQATGYLDKQGLFMALRLIAVCQAGKEPLASNMALGDPPPKLVGMELPPASTVDSDRAKYEQMFQGLQPSKGLLPGDKARPFMLASKLPMDTLGKIWSLSDIDKDGSLDLDEFCVAMRLIAMAKTGEVLPAVLPASLVPQSKTKLLSPPPSSSSSTPSSSGPAVLLPTVAPSSSGAGSAVLLPTAVSPSTGSRSASPAHSSPMLTKKSTTPVGAVATPLASVDWVVTKELQTKYDGYFQGIDKDHDGYVSGEEAKSLFMASNLQQNILGHIWNLCDIEKTGRLNAEQFALAMYLIAEKVRKKDIPDELTPAMVPPSLRGKVTLPPPSTTPSSSAPSSSSAASGWGGGTLIPTAASSASSTSVTWSTPTSSGSAGGGDKAGFGSDFSAIQELDSITHEIDSIRKEKAELAEDIKAKQELIQQRRVEMESFQENVDQATKHRESLEREREEARAQLEQLNTEKAKFEGQMAELKQNCDDEREEIARLKLQLSEQESSNKSKSEEMEKLKEQLEQLKKEEQECKMKVEQSKAELDKIQKANHNLQSDITQVRQRIENLKEEQQSLNTALTLYPPTSASSGPSPTTTSGVVNINDVGKLSAELHVPHISEHDAISARATAGSSSPVSSLSGFSTNSHLDDGAEDGGGAKEDKRSSDPFATTSTSRDPFAAFSVPTSSEDGFGGGRSFSGSKPSDLSAFDPFGSSGGGPTGVNFDPFKSQPTVSAPAPATGEDLFRNHDPFSSASSAQVSTSSSNNSLPHANVAVDPFSGQDPFHADPFASSATTTTSSSTTSAAAQPSSLWGGSSPFDTDPFGQQNIQTPTDPFSGGDPFGDDPFAAKSGGNGGNPFQVGGGGGFAAVWKQDGGTKPS